MHVGDGATPASPRCRVATTDAEFDALRPDWDRLFTHNTHPSPFCSWIWVRTWWKHYQAHLSSDPMSLRPHIVCITGAEDRLIGIAPFYFAAPVNAPLRLASLRPMGSRLVGTQEDLTDEPVLLLLEGREQEALTALIDLLSAAPPELPHDYFVLRLYENASDPALGARFETLPKRCLLLKQEEQPGQTVILAETWDAFARGLGKSMRDNVKYYPRLLTRRGYVWEIETVTEPDALRDAAQILVDLHRRRAVSTRGISHTNHLPDDLQAEFLMDALQGLAARGMASLLRLRVNGVVVAALAVLRVKKTISIYYSGFDPVWYDYSPVTILTAEALRQAIARGDTTANFLPGEFAWKGRWGSVSDRTMVQYTYLLRRPGAILRAGYEAVRRTLMRFADSPSQAVR